MGPRIARLLVQPPVLVGDVIGIQDAILWRDRGNSGFSMHEFYPPIP
jgi:hypothetical protein